MEKKNDSQSHEGHGKKIGYLLSTIESKNIIPGDVIILKEGDVVPCDCVLICG